MINDQSILAGTLGIVAGLALLVGCESSPPPPSAGDPAAEPILLAADRGWLSRTMELLDEGADVNTADARGCTLLHLAADGGHDELVRALIRRGAALDAPDKQGNTPLHLAAIHSHEDTVQELNAAGADRTIRNAAGKTAADVADPSVRPLVLP